MCYMVVDVVDDQMRKMVMMMMMMRVRKMRIIHTHGGQGQVCLFTVCCHRVWLPFTAFYKRKSEE